MPTFDTPAPIRARIELVHGAVQVHADDRHDTTVTVRPRDAASSADVTAAKQTQVTFRDGELLVRSTTRPRLLFFGSGPEIEIDVVLPAGSSLDVRTTAGDITCTGRLGAAEEAVRSGEQVTIVVVTGDPAETGRLVRLRVTDLVGCLRRVFAPEVWQRVRLVLDDASVASALGVTDPGDETEAAVRVQDGVIVARSGGRGAGHAVSAARKATP